MFVFTLLFVPIASGLPISSIGQDGMLDRLFETLNSGKREEQPPCSKMLNVSWLSKPPFIMLNNSSGVGRSLGGIFHDVLGLALNSCRTLPTVEHKLCIRYNIQAAANKSTLHQDILTNKADLILPVQSDEKVYRGFLPYIKILQSPGIALIQRNDSQHRGDKNIILWNTITGCLPIVGLTLLLSFVAGMFVWTMETKENTQEFASPFYRGAFDGFWWAFVTMTTVGYGDKTPKSIIGRLFSVLWIIIGVTMCSILTATLSSALTNITVETYEVLPGKRIGVTKDSAIALQKAVNLGMEVTVFENLDEAHDAVVATQAVDGILEEMLTAIEYLNQQETSLLSIVRLFEEPHGYGVAFRSLKTIESVLLECMSNVSEFVIDDVHGLYAITLSNHFSRIKKLWSNQVKAQIVIDPKSPVFFGTVICFSGVTLLFFVINMILKFYRSESVKIRTPGQRKETILRENGPLQWDENYLEFSVTDFMNGPFSRVKTPESNKDHDN